MAGHIEVVHEGNSLHPRYSPSEEEMEAMLREVRLVRDFREKLKPFRELIVEERFIVQEIFWECTGMHTLYVHPRRDISTRVLHFDKPFSFRSDEEITARIPKMTPILLKYVNPGGVVYFDRDFKHEENAIELASLDGRESFQSSNYHKFMRK